MRRKRARRRAGQMRTKRTSRAQVTGQIPGKPEGAGMTTEDDAIRHLEAIGFDVPAARPKSMPEPTQWERIEPGCYWSRAEDGCSDGRWYARRLYGSGIRGWILEDRLTGVRRPFKSFERAKRWVEGRRRWVGGRP